MKAFLSSCHFLVLLFPAVTAVICYHNSLVENPEYIQGDCEIEGGFCFSRITDNHLNVPSRMDSEAGCATNCPKTNYSFTTQGGFYLISSTYCCQDVLCNMDELEKPKLGDFNGRQCEACHAPASEGCSGLNTIRCRGAETQCISFVIVHNDSSISDEIYQGCATPSFCDLARNSPYNEHFSGTITNSRCCETLRSSEQLNFEG
ncbi:urokinase plasminogen activator surface receptor-like [Lacerta agilis]|uniref:urokinase plasminogen activator surface receptor-like n=1 Tax=Lacerta agilis TaxID=80427 RepID=UPI0014195E08|nr:urokinase plasminogen activator surface receptor-like [Lacerta agilis]